MSNSRVPRLVRLRPEDTIKEKNNLKDDLDEKHKAWAIQRSN